MKNRMHARRTLFHFCVSIANKIRHNLIEFECAFYRFFPRKKPNERTYVRMNEHWTQNILLHFKWLGHLNFGASSNTKAVSNRQLFDAKIRQTNFNEVKWIKNVGIKYIAKTMCANNNNFKMENGISGDLIELFCCVPIKHSIDYYFLCLCLHHRPMIRRFPMSIKNYWMKK